MLCSGDARLGARLPGKPLEATANGRAVSILHALRVVQGGAFGPANRLTKLDTAWDTRDE